MTRLRVGAAMVAMAILATQPCAVGAQDFYSNERRSSAFAGMKINMPIGQRKQEKPTARLQFTTHHEFRDLRTGELRTVRPAGLELGVAHTGNVTLTIGGREAPKVGNQLGVSGTGKTVLIIGGVVLVGLILAVAAAPAPDIFGED